MFLKKVFCFPVWAILVGCLVASLPARGADLEKPRTEERAAVVDGGSVSREEYDREVLRIQGALLGRGKPLTCAQVAAVGGEVLESLIRREILHQESRKAGIRIDRKEIDKEIDALRKQFLSEAEYKNELNRRNLSEAMLRANVERTLLVQKFVEQRFLEKANVTDADLVAYYENRLYLFKQPLQVAVSHILIQSDARWDASRKQEARRKAEQILKDLKNGKDFAALARELSDGPTRTSGGDLGYIRMGQLEKPLESVVFNLKTGEISSVVETDYGFHLFKVTDRKPDSILAYDAVKEQIRQSLREEKAKQDADLYAKTLREKTSVQILVPELANNPG